MQFIYCSLLALQIQEYRHFYLLITIIFIEVLILKLSEFDAYNNYSVLHL